LEKGASIARSRRIDRIIGFSKIFYKLIVDIKDCFSLKMMQVTCRRVANRRQVITVSYPPWLIAAVGSWATRLLS
jgi:hypothetical protein